MAKGKHSILTIILFLLNCIFGQRIIGGNEVDISKHPYLVSIRYRITSDGPYVHKCAGVIYQSRIVVTAAQCVVDIGDNERVLIIVAGNSRTGLDGLIYTATKHFHHTNYSSWSADYDIGLLVIDDVFDFKRNYIQSIDIMKERPKNGQMAVVAGWGYREEFGPSSKYLEEIKVPIISLEDCLNSYGESVLTEHMICAGYMTNGGKDACQGDTGGPLIINRKLVGLVSWGRGCARPAFPTVYTLVTNLKEWLDNTIAYNNLYT